MTANFNDCLKRGNIKKFLRGSGLVRKELRIAKDDYATAQKSFKDGNYRWSIVQTYYAMFHAARALLYQKNYKEHSHHCLLEAIRELYVKEKLIPLHIFESFKKAKILKEEADYYGDFSELNAERLLKDGQIFISEVEKICTS